ncbi:hypothetical protein [uncultured Tateyamaria sp.]|uniref:hypothetical protein n=1 Tax=uncultured Tateyamaria sp. TaxID=455651 RepID=UPI002614CC93|nr:hypothetical protein [uncultured Tateyamaria sp.]
MEIPSLDTALVRLTDVFPYYIEFILGLMALMGLFFIVYGGVSAWRTATVGGRGQLYGQSAPTPWSALGLMLLGGALSVPLVLLWDIAGTFVLGGTETYNMLSYLPPPDSSPWCERVKGAVILFFMCIGITSLLWSGFLVYVRITSFQGQGTGLKVLGFLCGAVLCFMITDVAILLSNTFGLDISFDNVCTILGGDSAP